MLPHNVKRTCLHWNVESCWKILRNVCLNVCSNFLLLYVALNNFTLKKVELLECISDEQELRTYPSIRARRTDIIEHQGLEINFLRLEILNEVADILNYNPCIG